MGAAIGGTGFQKHSFSLMDGYITLTQKGETDRNKQRRHIEDHGDKIKQRVEGEIQEKKRGMTQCNKDGLRSRRRYFKGSEVKFATLHLIRDSSP